METYLNMKHKRNAIKLLNSHKRKVCPIQLPFPQHPEKKADSLRIFNFHTTYIRSYTNLSNGPFSKQTNLFCNLYNIALP